MLQKINKFLSKFRIAPEKPGATPPSFTRKQLENAYKLGYNDGKRDGLSIARQQATQSLKEILWQQNKHQRK